MTVKTLLQKANYLRIFPILALITIGLAWLGWSGFARSMDDTQPAQMRLALRAVVDGLLRSSGDSITPVPPIERLSEHRLSVPLPVLSPIDPDTLVELALTHLNANLIRQYLIEVTEVNSGQVVYAFEVDHHAEHQIPCLGRVLPPRAYAIDFYPISSSNQQPFPETSTLSMVGILLVFVSLTFLLRKERSSPSTESVASTGITIDPISNQLFLNGVTIPLTNKEVQVLQPLLEQFGTLISREQLMQEVWQDEGVINSRSLDMYISRLRKKLAPHSDIKIENVRGKGYKLTSNHSGFD